MGLAQNYTGIRSSDLTRQQDPERKQPEPEDEGAQAPAPTFASELKTVEKPGLLVSALQASTETLTHSSPLWEAGPLRPSQGGICNDQSASLKAAPLSPSAQAGMQFESRKTLNQGLRCKYSYPFIFFCTIYLFETECMCACTHTDGGKSRGREPSSMSAEPHVGLQGGWIPGSMRSPLEREPRVWRLTDSAIQVPLLPIFLPVIFTYLLYCYIL